MDLFMPKSTYNSIHLNGGAWVQIINRDDDENDINVLDDSFTLEFWITGQNIDTESAPAILTIRDSSGILEFGIFRDLHRNNVIIVCTSDGCVETDEIDGLDWSDDEEFHYLAITSNQITLDVYLDGEGIISKLTSGFDIGSNDLFIGVNGNNYLTMLDNFWFGYLSEIRMWNTDLASSMISFHYVNPNKLTEQTESELLDNLKGLWRFNLLETDSYEIMDESGNDNDGEIRTLQGYEVELSVNG